MLVKIIKVFYKDIVPLGNYETTYICSEGSPWFEVTTEHFKELKEQVDFYNANTYRFDVDYGMYLITCHDPKEPLEILAEVKVLMAQVAKEQEEKRKKFEEAAKKRAEKAEKVALEKKKKLLEKLQKELNEQ